MENACLYEKIDHPSAFQFKCFTASLESSCPHWHDDYEFIVLLKGEICVRNNGRKYNMHTGDIMLINSREIHSIFDCSKGNICLFLQFDPALIIENTNDVRNKIVNFHLNTCDSTIKAKIEPSHFIKTVANIWLLAHEKKEGYKFYLQSKFYGLIGDLFRYAIYDERYPCTDPMSENNTLILDRLTSYVQERYNEEINQDDICKHLGMSRSTLYRFMKNYLGISVNDFIHHYRIKEAKNFLKNTNYSISHIATLCGYSNETSFYRAFKKQVKKTPNEYRTEGVIENHDDRIQGYTSYDNREAYKLIKKYAI